MRVTSQELVACAALVVIGLTLGACGETVDGAASDGARTATEAASSDGETANSEGAGSVSGSVSGSGSAETDGMVDSGSESGADPTSADQTGEELYVAMCAPCHGPEGEGSQLGYELRHHDAEHFEWVVRNGRPGTEFAGSVMAAYGVEVLPDESVDKIWAYLDAFPQPDSAEGLYLDYCGNCHGPDGTNGVVGVDISDEELADAREEVREGSDLENVGAQDRFMPAIDSDRLTDDELELVVDFFGG